MIELWLPVIAGILVAVLGNGAALLLLRSQKQKLAAEVKQLEVNAADVLSKAASNMVTRWERRVLELEAAVEELKKRVRVLEEENECLRDGNEKLSNQVESLGEKPVWRLPDANPPG